MNRKQTLDFLRSEPQVDVLVIGGGINGAGTFRDLALQGLDVLLVERGDFCSGSSAASSHMVHGGIRYLENGEFRLVREAVHERNRLLKNAPQYVQPLATVIPMFKWFSGALNAPLKFLGVLTKPAERGGAIIKAGLVMYDAFTRDNTVPSHEFTLRNESLQKYPQLNPDIVCTATYYDAAMHAPERILLEVILDGEAAAQQAGNVAKALNYAPAVDVEKSGGGDAVLVRDESSGETFRVRPKLVVNAAGPWIDFVNRALDQETNFIGGTKGSHLVLDHPELKEAIQGREFFFENEDGRIVLVYPLRDKLLVGTSDIRVDTPEDVVCTDEEIDYFIGLVKRVFPKIEVNRSHIVYTYSGVRPLPASEAKSAGQISRDHSIRTVEPNGDLAFPILSLVGGKWTSFRAFAEQTTDAVLSRFGRERVTSTADLPIGGGANYPRTDAERQGWLRDLAQESELPQERLAQLFERYGTRARDVAHFIADLPGADAPLTHHPAYSRGEIQFLAQREGVAHLDDLVMRRTLMAMLGELSDDLVVELAEVSGEALGWDEAAQQAEVEQLLRLMRESHRIDLRKRALA